jgi:hypothetical protein
MDINEDDLYINRNHEDVNTNYHKMFFSCLGVKYVLEFIVFSETSACI